jgi:hypothetical protein
MQAKPVAIGLHNITAGVLVALLFWPSSANAANGQQCAATSTLRGQFCSSPVGGFANRAQCLAAYNVCLNILPGLMHQWCVQIDQPNCNRNDDCPRDSSCHVHPVNQRRRTNTQCHQDAQNMWQFDLFDVADCKCDCSDGAFPPPPGGPEAITLACGDGSIACPGCTAPGEGEQVCVGETVSWVRSAGTQDTTVAPPKTPAKAAPRSRGCGGCIGKSGGSAGALALLSLLGVFCRRK